MEVGRQRSRAERGCLGTQPWKPQTCPADKEDVTGNRAFMEGLCT